MAGPPERAPDYRSVNRSAWTRLANQGNSASQPVDEGQLAGARSWLDPDGWIEWERIQTVLCLASGGGQQAVLFASLGYKVVSADLCPEQLMADHVTAQRYGYNIEYIEADMLELSALHGRNFDLVYQAISSCYVPSVEQLYSQVARTLRPGGKYRVDHWHPVHMQLGDRPYWTGEGYQLLRPYQSGARYAWRSSPESGEDVTECWHYLHTLSSLVGSLCSSRFRLLGLAERRHNSENAEPGTEFHVESFVPPVLSLFAERVAGKNSA